jgi:tetratricopeptide (TPR) repeat protein
VREGNEWLIHNMIDAGAEALQLPTEELQEQLTEIAMLAAERLNLIESVDDEEIEDLDDEVEENADEIEAEKIDLEEIDDDDDEDEDELDDLEFDELAEHFEEMMLITKRAMHYTDALIAQTPEDAALYEMGYDQASAIQENERAAAYIELQAERFPEQRGEALRKLAIAQINIARTYEENKDEKRAMQFIVEAEKVLRDSLIIDDAPLSKILLAETLIIQEKDSAETEQFLQDALGQESIDEKEVTLAEAALGKVLQGRRDFKNALQHYQRAAEINPDFPGIWFNIGFMQRQLGQLEEAEESYERSIDESPAETGAYVELAAIYSDRGEYTEAEQLLDEGLEINPESADLLASMALVFIKKGEMQQAKEYLDEAEDIDSEQELVQVARQHYDATRARLKEERQAFKKKQRNSRKSKRK